MTGAQGVVTMVELGVEPMVGAGLARRLLGERATAEPKVELPVRGGDRASELMVGLASHSERVGKVVTD